MRFDWTPPILSVAVEERLIILDSSVSVVWEWSCDAAEIVYLLVPCKQDHDFEDQYREKCQYGDIDYECWNPVKNIATCA